MPYWIVRRRPDQWCVINDDDRRVMGCHGTIREAQAQLTDLNIAESNRDNYRIESLWCVIKNDDHRVMGCHPSPREAQAQLTALNIAELNGGKYKITPP